MVSVFWRYDSGWNGSHLTVVAKGNPMSVIARDIAKPAATDYSYLLYHGGIMPRLRSRRSGCLSMEERVNISWSG